MPGAEIGVASTKAFTCQLTVLVLLALKAARDRGRIDARRPGRASGRPAQPARPRQPRAWTQPDDIAGLAAQARRGADVLFLGRGQMYPLALEGALKLKEISYIHAEGYASAN